MYVYFYLFCKGNGKIYDTHDVHIFMYIFLLNILNNGLGYLVKVFPNTVALYYDDIIWLLLEK